MSEELQKISGHLVDIDKIVSDYETQIGVHDSNCGLHFRKGIEAVLLIKKDCVYTKQHMERCFNDSRKAYSFKGGMPSVFASFKTYIKTFKRRG